MTTTRPSCQLLGTLLGALLGAAAPAGAAFEDTGAGARALGMGNAFTALADDAQAGYYNPAGLATLPRAEFLSSYGRLHMGLSDGSALAAGHLAYVQPIPALRGALSLSWTHFSLLGDYQEHTVRLSHGLRLGKEWRLGMTLKWMMLKITQDDFTALDPVFANGGKDSVSAVGATLAAQYQPFKRLLAGLVLQDINRPDIGFGRTHRLPVGLRAGAAYPGKTLTLAMDILLRDGDWRIYNGLERRFSGGRFAARGGLGLGTSQFGNVSVGFGLIESFLHVDYAFIHALSGLGGAVGSHRLSISVPIGALPFEEAPPPPVMATPPPNEVEHRLDRQSKQIQELKKKIDKWGKASPKPKRRKRKAKPPKKKTPPPVVWPRRHIVRPGENLRSLAQKYYNDVSRWRDLYRANRRAIGPEGDLKIGRTLTIPK